MRWIPVLVLCFLVPACGKGDDATGGGGGGASPDPARPDPAELERKRKEEQAAAEARAKELRAKKEKLEKELKELTERREAMVQEHEKVEAGLPDRPKLRRVLQGLSRDLARARGIYETDRKRLDELEKEVRGSASAEIEELDKKIAAKEKEYNDILSGAKAERVNRDLGIVEETQVQKELRTLRAAKTKWFELTRETRRGSSGADAKARSGFRSWCDESELRKAVVAKALPDGQTPDGYDFSELEFYLYLELLEDKLDRENVAEEKKTLSENDKKLAALETVIDELREQKATKMIEGGGSLKQYTSLKDRIDDEKEAYERLERQVEEMRASYAEIDRIIEENEKQQYDLAKEIEARKKELAKVSRALR